uniref:integrin alpha-6-like n=1 Tax=Myxine glutinosa TaxID=7769 RepID=UPI00358FAACD
WYGHVNRCDYVECLRYCLSWLIFSSSYVARGRPVVSITKSVSAQPEVIDADSKNNPITFIVRPCASYTPKDPKYKQNLSLQYNLEVDAERREQGLAKRVDISSQIGRMKLTGPSANVCQSITFTLKANIRDKLSPIVFDFKFNLVKGKRLRQRKEADKLPSLDAFPVWNSSDRSARILVHILKKDCKNNICYSNLQLKSLFWPREDDNRGKNPLPRDDQGNQWLPLSKQKILALQVNVTNLPSDPTDPDKDGHAAHEAKLTVTLPPTLGYTGFRRTEKDITCMHVNDTTTFCTLGNPFKKGQESEFELLFDTSHITTGTSDIEIELLLTTMSEQAGLVPIKVHLGVQTEISFTVTGEPEPRQLSFGGSVVGESAMKVEEDVGSPLSILFTVTNFGRLLPSDATSFLSLHIAWPFETSSGKWLLYLMNAESMVGNLTHTCEVSNGQINPLKLQETTRKSRRRRNVETEVSSAKYGLEGTSKHLQETFFCSKTNTSRCQDVVCALPNIKEKAHVRLSARLWNSTFLETLRIQSDSQDP